MTLSTATTPAPTADFPYHIEAQVGSGGMGTVFRATEPTLNRVVAIKRVKLEMLSAGDPALAQETRDRFLREARAAAALSHPGITTIYRVGEDASGPFIAMEWLDGASLETLMEQGALGIIDVVRHGIALLETLDAAHGAGVVHRDIKPANIIVLKDGRLKVTDFGIARLQGGDVFRTQAGVVLASPRFASPEQMLGDEVDGRSDIFSTAVTLYLALTGQAPFEGKDYVDMVSALIHRDPLPPRQLNPRIPLGLEAVILRALRKRREERYPRAGQMADALRPFLENDSVGAATRPLPAVTSPSENTTSALRGLPRDDFKMVGSLAATWPEKALGRLPVRTTLDRLLDRSLHAEPFAGAVQFGRVLLLVHEGRVLGALDASARRSGDEVIESLPPQAEIILRPLPAEIPAEALSLLATLLNAPKIRNDALDSSFVNLPALARKLGDEGFEGILRLRRNGATGLVLLSAGRTLITMFSDGWEGIPVEEPWENWVSAHSVHARFEDRNLSRLVFEVRRKFKDLDLQVDATARPPIIVAPPSVGLKLSGQTGSPAEDPAVRFLSWGIEHLPAYFAERGKTDRWKYAVEWLAMTRKARLHHELARPGGSATDFFDLVSFDEHDKALHLMHRVARAGQREVRDFVERVTAAKGARIKGGDIGAAFLVSPSFDPSALSAYRNATLSESGRWIEEALTRYEGFVRLGPRRGFHLLLVTERGDGFEPVLPG